MSSETDFIDVAGTALDIIAKLDTIRIFGIGAATWLMIFAVVSILLSLVFIIIPGIGRHRGDDD